MRIFLAFAIMVCCILTAEAVDINGTLLLEYEDREGGTGLIQNTQNQSLGIAQVDLRLTQELSEFNRAFARLSSSGGNVRITEGWLSFGGLPYDGTVTAGQFFKPLGAPVQHSGLSYPALLFHTSAVQGIKLSAEYYPWRGEIGVVNNNPFSQRGTTISSSSAFGRPLASTALPRNTGAREGYAFFGWQDGGTWGSLDVNVTGTYGKFSQTDMNLLDSLNILAPNPPHKGNRRGLDVSADYIYGPARLNGEYAVFKEGKLSLTAWNISGSWRQGKFNWIIGYDHLANNAAARPINVPASWMRRRVSYATTYEFNSSLQFRLQYEQNREEISGTANFGDHRGIPNDGITAQVKYTF